MSERLLRLRIERRRIRVLPNWADCESIKPVASAANLLRSTWKLSPYFVVGYSGNLGRAHEIETLLNAIREIEDAEVSTPPRVPIRWLFIGGGVLFEHMRKEATLRRLQSIEFHGYQPRQRLSESLSAADVHIVSLRPELEGLIVPSKFYGVAAAGRPTIFIGAPDGEIARLIDRHACGVSIATGDGPGLAKAVTALAHDLTGCRDMGERARAMCPALYSKNRTIDAWHTLLSEVTRTQLKPATDAVLDAKHDSFVS
jgi:colanic acid biosynthesis glycosyl transferase WcaI